jgi:hypothetical protein
MSCEDMAYAKPSRFAAKAQLRAKVSRSACVCSQASMPPQGQRGRTGVWWPSW